MPQWTCENPLNCILVGFSACAVMVILLLMGRDPRDHPPIYWDYPRYRRPHRVDYPERRRPGSVLILMVFVAFVLAIIALLTS